MSNDDGTPDLIKEGSNEAPAEWLDRVLLEGSTEPVRVVFEARQGRNVYVRQVDPCDTSVDPVAIYEGDDVIVMTPIGSAGLMSTSSAGPLYDLLTTFRMELVRREEGVVYVRTLRPDAPDTGRRVHVRPGDTVRVEAGDVTVDLDAIDALEPASDNGFVPITPVLWTWFQLGDHGDLSRIRYLLAIARRLDTANMLLIRIEQLRTRPKGGTQSGSDARRRVYEMLGTIEVMVVALGRVVDMILKAGTLIHCPASVPVAITSSGEAIKAIRNAYEHIEDRAIGQVKGKPNSQALTIFDYEQLFRMNTITYGTDDLELGAQLPTVLAASREFLKEASRQPPPT